MKHYLFGIALLVPLSGAVDAAAVSYDIQRIGLVDDSYESIDYEYSYVLNLNEQGQVAGHTERHGYDGSGNSWGLGQDAWLYDSGTTTQIGYTGADKAPELPRLA